LARPGGAAVGLPGVGLSDARGGGRPVPSASLAKILTGYLVLRDHPLPAGGSGPAITVTAADAAAFAGDQRLGQSVVKVVRGEKLTELQALQAMLIPSGNNIVSLLARCDAGLQAAFVAKMSAAAARSDCAARGAPPSAAPTRPRRALRLAHAPAALSSFVARSQMHLCPDGHGTCYGSRQGVAECRKRRCTRSHVEPGVDAASALASTAASAWVRWRHGDKCGGIMCREPARPASEPGTARRGPVMAG
jgi:D-alanyl-D-alanine carboxypeptidase